MIALLAALLASALLGAQAHAQAGRTGAYFGAGVMQVYTDNASEFATYEIGFGGSGDSHATGFKVYGGYVWPSRFGFEAGWYDLGTYDVTLFNVKSDEFRISALAFLGTWWMPINPSVDVLFKFGLAFTDVEYRCLTACGWPYVDTNTSDVTMPFSIGVNWRVASGFSVRAEYEYFGFVVHRVGGLMGEYDYSAVSIAGQFHF
jgi:OOP family OmpA-OmpF porin